MTILGHDVNGRPLRAGDRVEVAEGAAHGHGRTGRLIGPCPDFAGQLEAQMEHGPLGSARAEHWRRIDDRTDHQPSEYTFDSLMDHLKSGVPA
ncbi:MAG: hypothetical protein FH747_03000 [Stenotrophomonas sp.]|uniref:hypothetical protein n=1 Tax=Stenotrophomonas sp. TaxID=69392 RepID=UPI000C0EB5A8|nr:hypothetical protein [Stenotrophomonas sp.]MTI72555.1 hypothetical protein [Stenotrophomonas sp.]MTI72615.1 hypothetical protein [Stenotrophomonas sp.]PHR17064.1 MAG: hypothetical protein COA41_12835 [Sphingopyxis sp.]